MNPEIQLIAKVLETGELKTVVESGLRAEDLLDEECRGHLQWLEEYYTDPQHPRAVPTRDMFLEHRPDTILPETDRTSVKELIEVCKKRSAKKLCQQMGEDLILMSEEDPASALSFVAAAAIKEIGRLVDTKTISVSDYVEEIFSEYQKSKEGVFNGVRWPWARLNERTKGIENGNFVLIYGRAKQMKTWIALYIAAEHYRKYFDSRVLVYSLEMPVKQMAQRLAAILARVPYSDSLLGQLSFEEEARFYEVLRDLKVEEESTCTNGKRKGLFVVTPSSDSASVLDLRNKIDLFDPDLVIVDGVYNMAASLQAKRFDWREVAKVSRDIKMTALDYNLPIIGVSQANRDEDAGSDMRDMGFTDNLSRDPDVIMKVHKQVTDNMGTVLVIAFKGVREFDVAGILIYGNPATKFDFIQEFDNLEQMKEFMKKSKQAIAVMRSKDDPSKALGLKSFATAQMMFDRK